MIENLTGFARIELSDGTLLEGRVVQVRREDRRINHTSPFGGVTSFAAEEPIYTIELRDPTTTHGWRQLHAAGEDMGVPITRKPTPEEDPDWGTWS